MTQSPIAPRRTHLFAARGFTLIEVILALSLVAILVAALGSAIDFHFRAVAHVRSQIEEQQLARALLERIARDIRGAVPYDPIDFEQLVPGMVTTTSAGDLGEVGEEGGFDSDILFGTSTGSSTEDESTTDDLTALTLPHPVPGLFGDSSWLQVDVSRLPRPDQMTTDVIYSADGLTVDRVSDVKSVAYFVVDADSASSYTYSNRPGISDFEESGGLVRRELDRAVTQYASESGLLDLVDEELEPVAPEVVDIQFSYFDGSTWQSSWDSDLNGSLPTAVEVVLYLRSRDVAPSVLLPIDEEEGTIHAYRRVVYLPAAHPVGELNVTALPASETESGGSAGSESGGETPESGGSGGSQPVPDVPSGDGGSGGNAPGFDRQIPQPTPLPAPDSSGGPGGGGR